jgi:Cft2 family RNA processing exonuclease
MGNKKKEKAKISFVGYSSEDVTGSCHMITYDKKQYLLDFGTYQHANKLKSYQINNRNLNKIIPKNIRGILISHYHL